MAGHAVVVGGGAVSADDGDAGGGGLAVGEEPLLQQQQRGRHLLEGGRGGHGGVWRGEVRCGRFSLSETIELIGGEG